MIAIRGVLCAALLAGTVTPALAQTTQAPAKASEFETIAIAMYNPCNQANPKQDPAGVEAVCTKTLANLDTLKQAAEQQAGAAGVAAHDLNLYHAFKATAAVRISHAWLTLDDNVRTKRVCAKIEESWGYASKVNLATLAPGYAAVIKPFVDESANVTRTCRNEHEAPANAPALPS